MIEVAATDDGAGSVPGFGSCCSELKQAMAADDFEPMITQGPDGVLYMVVGMIDIDKPEPGMVDHPIFFCPFCGTSLQNAHDVKAKVERASAASAEMTDEGDDQSPAPATQTAAPSA